MQKRASGGAGSPHDGQALVIGLPQLMQKRACSGLGVEHDPHIGASANQITPSRSFVLVTIRTLDGREAPGL
jgi:hypothetical protein